MVVFFIGEQWHEVSGETQYGVMKFLKSLNFAHDEELIFYAFLVISPKLSQEELISEGSFHNEGFPCQ